MTMPFIQPNSIRLRDGEVVVYRRTRSLIYQCRYKLADGTWHRRSTGKAALEHAIARACDLYDESRYRQKLGLAHRAHSLAHIAGICLHELRHQIDLKKTKSSLNDYASVIERYFIPYFGERQIEELTHSDIREFEIWRDRRLSRRPKTSTLNNFSSAWNRVIATAIEHGFISEHVRTVAVPGNWEHWSDVDFDALGAIIQSQPDGRLLLNERWSFKHGDRRIELVGLDDFTAGQPDLRLLVPSASADVSLLVQHSPGFFDKSEVSQRMGTGHFSLCLSGHTHGGQIAIAGWTPFRPMGSGRFLSGFYDVPGCRLFVSKGVGTSVLPVRFGVAPEVVVFEL